jgi:YteA family regulatory protein
MRQQEQIKARLVKEKKRLETIGREIAHGGLKRQQGDVIGELSLYDNHPGDVGSETFERGKDIGLWDNNRRLLSQVNRALNRLDAGTYGICAHCGQEIEPGRLKALPWSILCHRCQTDKEAGLQHDSNRPLEEQVLTPPFARTLLDQSEYVGFDREDAWQAVARYGTATSQDEGSNADTNHNEQSGTVEDVEAVVIKDGLEPFGLFSRRRKKS